MQKLIYIFMSSLENMEYTFLTGFITADGGVGGLLLSLFRDEKRQLVEKISGQFQRFYFSPPWSEDLPMNLSADLCCCLNLCASFHILTSTPRLLTATSFLEYVTETLLQNVCIRVDSKVIIANRINWSSVFEKSFQICSSESLNRKMYMLGGCRHLKLYGVKTGLRLNFSTSGSYFEQWKIQDIHLNISLIIFVLINAFSNLF